MYPVLATQHLRLRPFIESDCPKVAALTDAGGIDTAIELPRPLMSLQAERWMASHALLWETLQALHWAVTPLDDTALLGYVGVSSIDLENRQARLAFRIGSLRQRNRYAVEAAQAALAFGFTELGMHRISAGHRVRQPPAAEALASLGLRREGLLRQDLWDGEQFEDVVLWAILRTEWMELMHGPSARAAPPVPLHEQVSIPSQSTARRC